MAPPKGTVNNPSGRPPKHRALTTLLEKGGNKTVMLANGKRVSSKRLLARSIWEGITTGFVTFPNGTSYKLDPDEWMELVQFVYKHIDGNPPQRNEITGAEGNEIVFKVVHE